MMADQGSSRDLKSKILSADGSTLPNLQSSRKMSENRLFDFDYIVFQRTSITGYTPPFYQSRPVENCLQWLDIALAWQARAFFCAVNRNQENKLPTGWWFGTFLYFSICFHTLGIIIPTEFHILQRG